jgi:lysophospholipase L1-like esterase
MLTQYLIEACRSAIRGVDKYIILTSPVGNGSTAEPYKPLHRAMVHAFGDHCINIVDYLIQHGLADAKKTETPTDSENIAAYKIPRSLRATNSNGTEDHIHLNAAGYAVVANQVYKRGQLLGYWT